LYGLFYLVIGGTGALLTFSPRIEPSEKLEI